MSSVAAHGVETILSVPGVAADHLYREGSAKASFWEAVFGSSLRAKSRTHVSGLEDGTRVFDVPLLKAEHEILRSAGAWMAEQGLDATCFEAAALLAAGKLRARLIGLQARGTSEASFELRIEPRGAEVVVDPAVPGAFRSWFGAEGSRLARETLIPFGFTPHSA
ncbi:MAG: hypothetical protein JJE39_15755 [Vicinamibacteria bacterium]|nr:hypothetical protein [Vicinamibacteria bacterium]